MSIDNEKIKIALIIIENVVKGLKIGEQSFAFPEGTESLEFTSDELLKTRPNGVEWFADKITNDVLPISLKRQLLGVMIDIGENCSFSKCAIADALDISRELNNKVMRIASSCGVIGPRAHQFRIKSGVVSQLKKQLDLLNREEGIESEIKPRFKPTTDKETVEKARQIAQELKDEKESVEKEHVIPVSQTLRNQILPKKKPALLSSPVPGKKPQKPLK